MFVPRQTKDIAAGLNSRIVARSPLTDLAAGGPLERLTYGFAEELATVEQRILGVRDSFNLLDPSISLADFDERLQELPRADEMARKSTSFASGSVMNITRATAGAVQVLPAGTIFARKDTGSKYKTLQDYSFGAPVGTLTGVEVISLVPGSAGNCGPGVINQMTSGPSWIVGAVNTTAITNGQDEESLQQAQQRISLYFSSLSRCQPGAFEYAAPSYQTSVGTQVKFAKVYVDHEKPGFSDLVVDDGTGMPGLKKAGMTATAVVPANGIKQLWHEAPATAPIPFVTVNLALGGHYNLIEGVDYTSIYERGIVQLKTGVTIAPGDTWEITGYQVYTGILAELQRYIDGSVSDPFNSPGWVAGGCRCIVQPPVPVYATFDIHVVPFNGYDAYTAAQAAKSTAIAFLASLGPGETLFSGKLISVIMDTGALQGVHLYQTGTNTPVGDWYCGPKEVLRGSDAGILTIPALP